MRDKERQVVEVLGGIFEEYLLGRQSIGVSVDINPDKLSEETFSRIVELASDFPSDSEFSCCGSRKSFCVSPDIGYSIGHAVEHVTVIKGLRVALERVDVPVQINGMTTPVLEPDGRITFIISVQAVSENGEESLGLDLKDLFFQATAEIEMTIKER